MLDSTLRPVKDRALGPLVRGGPIARLHPTVISALGLVLSLGAAVAAWQQLPLVAVALWLAGRAADGLDGLVARSTNRQSDIGGLLDFLFDTIGYAAVPIGIALGVDDRATWIATAVVVATFYVNAVSLGHVATVLEKRSVGGASRNEPTSTTLPRGLVEGTETIVVFSLALAFPGAASVIWIVMAAAVAVTAVERTWWAARTLGGPS